MTTNLTGVDTFHTVVAGPATGEDITGASVCDPAQLLLNNTTWLKNRVAGRYLLAESTQARAAVTDAPSLAFDMKAITTWTPISGVTSTSTIAVQQYDIVRVSLACHANSTRAGAGYLGFRVKLAYTISGAPATANVFTRRWLGAAGPHTIHLQPISLFVEAGLVLAGTEGTVTASLECTNTTAPGGADDINIMNPWQINMSILRLVPVP